MQQHHCLTGSKNKMFYNCGRMVPDAGLRTITTTFSDSNTARDAQHDRSHALCACVNLLTVPATQNPVQIPLRMLLQAASTSGSAANLLSKASSIFKLECHTNAARCHDEGCFAEPATPHHALADGIGTM